MHHDTRAATHDWTNDEPGNTPAARLRAFLSEIGSGTRADLTEEAFFGRLLKGAVKSIAADGAVVWKREAEGSVKMFLEENAPAFLTSASDAALRNSKLLLEALAKGTCLLVPLEAPPEAATIAGQTGYVVILAPVKDGEQVTYLLQVFQRPTTRQAMRRTDLRVAERLSNLAEDFLRNSQLRKLQAREAVWGQVDRFHDEVHRSLRTREACATIANEGRLLIGCDRVSVALRRGRRFRVAAVSGQDTLDGRAPAVRRLDKLVDAVVQAGEPVWWSGLAEDLAPEIDAVLNEYVEEAHAKQIGIIPILPPQGDSADDCEQPRPLGAIIVEQLEAGEDVAGLPDRAELVCQQSARALANAIEYEGLFLAPVWRALSHSRWLVQARTLPKTAAVAAAAVLVSAILTWVPYDFEVLATGTLQPTLRREVFAPSDGAVDRILIRHGDHVSSGQLLAQLRNTDLDVQITDLTGQRAAAQAQLASVERALFEDAKHLSKEERNRLSGQRSELQQQLASLTHQLALLANKLQRLRVLSPVAGEVTTWNVEELLHQRPVRQGEALLSVADPAGDWELELRVPEDRMGYIAEAQRELCPGLRVTYRMATDPVTDHAGSVEEVHRAAEISGEDGNTVLVRVRMNKQDLAHLQPGAECRAKIDCGKRALGYVLFHDVVGFIHSRILFRL